MQKSTCASRTAPQLALHISVAPTMVALEGAHRYLSKKEHLANVKHRRDHKQPKLTTAEARKYRTWVQSISHDSYAPFIPVNTFRWGSGSRCVEFSARENRSRHFLSHGELHLSRQLERLPMVTAIHEQFALPPDVTLMIADSLGFAHPAWGNAHVMTSDFRVRFKIGNQDYGNVLAYKPFDVMNNPQNKDDIRAREKLLIECHYWEMYLGIPWRLITAKDVSPILHYNLDYFREAADRDHCNYLQQLSLETIDQFCQSFCAWLISQPDLTIDELIQAVGSDLSLPYPHALRVFKHLAWHERLPLNLFKPVELFQPAPRVPA